MNDVFDEATWRETIDDSDSGEFPWLNESKACEHAVITAMVDHAPWSLSADGINRGWSVEDAARVAAACQVFYTPGPRIGDTAYEQVGEDYVTEHYPGADKDPVLAFDSEDFDRIGGSVVDAENESGRSVWIDCDECGHLCHFDGAMVRGETTP